MIETYQGRNPWQTHRAIKQDLISLLSEVSRDCGDFVRIRTPFSSFYFVNEPDLIHEALVNNSEALILKGGAAASLAHLIGNGILTNHGQRWRESRRGLQPLFHQNAAAFPAIMQARVQESLARWRTHFPGQPVPLSQELLALSFRILCSTLFETLPSFEDAAEFAGAMAVLQSDGMTRYLNGGDLVRSWPLPLNRRINRAKATLLRLARAAAVGKQSPPVEEILSLFFAGTESPANTLLWAFQLLAGHPEWRRKLAAPPGNPGADPGAPGENTDALSQVLSETLRLYPAGWAFERYAAREIALGGERIKRGARILISPFHLHRNPRLWSEPGQFNPARFQEAFTAPAGMDKYSYLPFGAGPRSCIGSRMAWLEMRIILPALVAEFDWPADPVPDWAPTPVGSYKLRLSQATSARMR